MDWERKILGKAEKGSFIKSSQSHWWMSFHSRWGPNGDEVEEDFKVSTCQLPHLQSLDIMLLATVEDQET